MVCDDKLRYFIGATLSDVNLRDIACIDDGGDRHDLQMMDVVTSKGVFTVANHNEHNGWYGGFNIIVRIE